MKGLSSNLQLGRMPAFEGSKPRGQPTKEGYYAASQKANDSSSFAG
jgi:hypothetical protein